MKFKITHTTKYSYSQAVPVCHNTVHLAPRTLPTQACQYFGLLVHPEPTTISQRDDYFGNHVSHFSIDHAHLGMTVTATSHVDVAASPSISPKETSNWKTIANQIRNNRSRENLDAYQYSVGSPSIQPFPELAEFARKSFSADRTILDATLDLTNRIFDEFAYDPRATTIHTPIKEVLEKRHGVCQDFAHLQIGCLRSLGLAARYVSGYLRTLPPPGQPRLIGADASHAWISVYCGEAGWIDVDPTNNVLASSDHVTVAWGRDYNDVCPIQGVIVGGGDHKMHVSVDVAPGE